MEDLKPGRELDALIAEKVMGLKRVGEYTQIIAGVKTVTDPAFSLDNTTGYAPHYSTSIAAAFEVVEKTRSMSKYTRDFSIELEKNTIWNPNGDRCQAWFRKDGADGSVDFMAEAETLPHAICLAALKAVGE